MDAPAYSARSVKMQMKTPTSAFQNKILLTNTNEESLESGYFKLCRRFVNFVLQKSRLNVSYNIHIDLFLLKKNLSEGTNHKM